MRKVVEAIVNDDFTLDITFGDGSVRRFDMKPYLDYPIYRKLKNVDYFRDVKVAFDTVQWSESEDISPDTLFLESIPLGEKVVA